MSKSSKGALSKSRVMRGLQCPKSLHLTIHNPELETPVSEAQQAIFDQGHEVGLLAQKQYPKGVAVTAPHYDNDLALVQTKAALESGANTIFEATFQNNGVIARVDILHRETSNGRWKVIEVKSSTRVKNEHLLDAAIQSCALKGSEFEGSDIHIMHVNNKVVAPDLKEYFTTVKVTEDVAAIATTLPEQIEKLKVIANSDKSPKDDIGPHCDEPYECPFKQHCWKHVPSPSIFEIPRIGKKAWDYYNSGIIEVSHPKFRPSAGVQTNRVKAMKTGVRWVDKDIIAENISSWQWPLHYLDFETINPAYPRYAGTRPYQQIPFQFSCLKQEKVNGPVHEHYYLHEDSSDPRPFLVKELIEALKGDGSIAAFYKGFEASRMDELAEAFPEMAEELLNIKDRLVDPLPIFQSAVYDKDFKGSFSLKTVVPVILGADRSYKGMLIENGGAAQRGFLELIDKKPSETRRKELRTAMLEYCRKDTSEMLDLVTWLLNQSNSVTPAPRKKKRA